MAVSGVQTPSPANTARRTCHGGQDGGALMSETMRARSQATPHGPSTSRGKGATRGRKTVVPARARTVYKGRLITVRQVPVKRPDGQRVLFDIVLHADAVAIVA